MKKLIIQATVLFFGTLCLASSCKEERPDPETCGKLAVISDRYASAVSDPFTILSATMVGQCLELSIQASGCSGETWEAELLISPNIAESYPAQVQARMILSNEEPCDALPIQSIWFDLAELHSVSDRAVIALENYDEPLSFPGFQAADLLGHWELTNYSGGLTGVNQSVERGTVSLSFESSDVSISGNQTEIFPIATGSYDYTLEPMGNSLHLIIDGNDLGFVSGSAEEFTIDKRAVDGFLYEFER